ALIALAGIEPAPTAIRAERLFGSSSSRGALRQAGAPSGPCLGWVSPVSTVQAPGCLQGWCHPCLQQGRGAVVCHRRVEGRPGGRLRYSRAIARTFLGTGGSYHVRGRSGRNTQEDTMSERQTLWVEAMCSHLAVIERKTLESLGEE